MPDFIAVYQIADIVDIKKALEAMGYTLKDFTEETKQEPEILIGMWAPYDEDCELMDHELYVEEITEPDSEMQEKILYCSGRTFSGQAYSSIEYLDAQIIYDKSRGRHYTDFANLMI